MGLKNILLYLGPEFDSLCLLILFLMIYKPFLYLLFSCLYVRLRRILFYSCVLMAFLFVRPPPPSVFALLTHSPSLPSCLRQITSFDTDVLRSFLIIIFVTLSWARGPTWWFTSYPAPSTSEWVNAWVCRCLLTPHPVAHRSSDGDPVQGVFRV